MTGLTGAVGTNDHWLDWLKGNLLKGAGAEAAAGRLAAENHSTVQGFKPTAVNGLPGATEWISRPGTRLMDSFLVQRTTR